MERFLDVLGIISFGIIILVLVSVRRSHIRVEYSVSWLGTAVTILLLSRTQLFQTDLPGMLGISYPPLAVLLFVMILFLFVFYRFSVVISELKDANIALAQKVAILEYRIQSYGEPNEETEATRA